MNYNRLVGDLTTLLEQLKDAMFDFLPSLIVAIVVFFVGYLFARLVKALSRRSINNIHRLVPSAKWRARLESFMAEKQVAHVVSAVVYWILLFFFLTVATETLGLPVVTTWLSGLVGYLPRILVAVMIVFAGVIGGVVVKDIIAAAAASAGISYGEALAKLAQIAIVLTTVMVGVEQVGVDITFLTNVITITIGALFLGAALAFGYGARTSVSNILASHYLQKTYSVGQVVEIGETRGRIIKITSTAVVFESPRGQLLVPAKEFSEKVSALVVEEEAG